MIKTYLGLAFFLFVTLIMVKEVITLWKLDAEEAEIIVRRGPQGPLGPRGRIASPAGLFLGVAFLFSGLCLVLAPMIGSAGRPLVMGAAALVIFAFVTGASAWAFGIPRILVLPQFRTREAFRQATRR